MKNITRFTLNALLVVNAHMLFAADNVIVISSENQFNKEVLNSGKPAVVKVGATWCGACRAAESPFHKIAADFPNVVFATLDSDKNDAIATKYDVMSLPTFLYFNNGNLVKKQVGFTSGEVRSTLSSLAGTPEKKSPEVNPAAQNQVQINEPSKELAPEATSLEAKPEAEAAPACLAQTESFFERAYQATKDFFANLGNTISGWFK